MRIYPVFIPFVGCPYRCIYCNQKITTLKAIDGKDVLYSVKEQLLQHIRVISKSGIRGEVAFYGGTFTAIEPAVLESLVNEVRRWFREGYFTGFRCSTRPDALREDALKILREIPVSMIELGVQSLNDEVLRRIGRPYTENTVKEAVRAIQGNNWKVGIQIMVGLPGEDKDKFMETVKKTMNLLPDGVRIYPTLVFPDTPLARWYERGIYRPLPLKDAISWCVEAVMNLEGQHIPVMRVGLQTNVEFEGGSILGGPYHPAFGYLVRVHWWRLALDRWFEQQRYPIDQVTIEVPSRFRSEFYGPKGINVVYWKKRWNPGILNVKFIESVKTERCFSVT